MVWYVCLSTTSTIYLQPYIEKIKGPYQLQAIEFKTELPGFSICIAGLEVVTSCYVTSCYNNSWSVFEICVWPLPMLAYLLSSASTSRIQDTSLLKNILSVRPVISDKNVGDVTTQIFLNMLFDVAFTLTTIVSA